MKIALIGPGIMPIPPMGWGAVEALVWDYSNALKDLGHDVLIVNTRIHDEIIDKVQTFAPDVAHLHYDDHIGVMSDIQARVKIATSHYGYLTQPARYDAGYSRIHQAFVQAKDCMIGCLSQEIVQLYRSEGVSEDRLLYTPNGALPTIAFEEKGSDRSIYLAKIDFRKRQHLFVDIPELYFAGRLHDVRFPVQHPRFFGEWSKERVYSDLTGFGNLVLLSDGEAAPLVVPEALMAGLGVVVSEVAAANLDRPLPFVEVIKEDYIKDIEFVAERIRRNREISLSMRKDIRKYALEKFSWENILRECAKALEMRLC